MLLLCSLPSFFPLVLQWTPTDEKRYEGIWFSRSVHDNLFRWLKFLFFFLCLCSRRAWSHDKSSRDATPGDIKSFEVITAFSQTNSIIISNTSPRPWCYMLVVSAVAIIRSVRLLTPFCLCYHQCILSAAFLSHQLVQFWHHFHSSFWPIFYCFSCSTLQQDVQSRSLDDVSDLNSPPFQVTGMLISSKKPNLDFTL